MTAQMHLRMTLLAVLSTTGFAVQATTSLSAVELREYCAAYRENRHSSSGAACFAYVRGFVDGALAIDPRIRTRSEARGESWTERARRTRLGPDHPGRPVYCIDDTVSVEDLITQLLEHSSLRPLDPRKGANELLVEMLTRFHSC